MTEGQNPNNTNDGQQFDQASQYGQVPQSGQGPYGQHPQQSQPFHNDPAGHPTGQDHGGNFPSAQNPSGGQPQYGQPQPNAGQYGQTQQPGQPQYGGQQGHYAPPQYGGQPGNYGQPQYGQPQYGQPWPPQPQGTAFNASTLFADPDQRWPLIAAILALFSFIGSFGTWATVTMYGFNEPVSGTAGGDGWLTLVLSLAVISLACVYLFVPAVRGKLGIPIAMIVVGALIFLIPVINLIDMPSGISLGWGLILIILASIAIIVMAVLHLLHVLKLRKQPQF